jgi:hypothetical protein
MHTIDQMFDVDFIDLENQSDSRISNWDKIGDQDYGDFNHPKIDLGVIYELPFVERTYGKLVI